MFRRQRRPKPCVFFFHLPQNLPAPSGGIRPVGYSSCIRMLEARRSPSLVALPQPLGLPVAHPHQHCTIPEPKLARLHSRQHSASLQLSLVQSCPPHPTSLQGHPKGTLLSRSQGDIIKVAQHSTSVLYRRL